MTQRLIIGASDSAKVAKLLLGMGGGWKSIKQAYVGVDGIWRRFYDSTPDLAINIEPSSNIWSYDYVGNLYTWTISFFCRVEGGVAPYQFYWTGGENTSPEQQYTTFYHVGNNPSSIAVTCMVIDATGTYVETTAVVG